MPFFTRHSPRHPTHDYTQRGVYFITICTADREHYLSNVIDGIVYLTQAGKIVRHHIDDIMNHFPHAIVDTYVIMPNHIHMILFMGDYMPQGTCRDEAPHRPLHNAPHRPTSQNISSETKNVYRTRHGLVPTQDVDKPVHKPKPGISPKPWSLSVIIGSFKSICTRIINRHIDEWKLELKYGDRFGRQGRYHDSIIKDPEAYRIIKKYIKNNPRKWSEDKFYV